MNVDQPKWFQALCTAQKLVRESKLDQYFTYLPPNVFHVTIFDLVTDFARELIKHRWPSGIPVHTHPHPHTSSHIGHLDSH
jgi:hypothetical protein